jgi:hypothetical protein
MERRLLHVVHRLRDLQVEPSENAGGDGDRQRDKRNGKDCDRK